MVFAGSLLPGSMSHWLLHLLTLTLQWKRIENAKFSSWGSPRWLSYCRVHELTEKKKVQLNVGEGRESNQKAAFISCHIPCSSQAWHGFCIYSFILLDLGHFKVIIELPLFYDLFSGWEACGIPALQPGVGPAPPALEGEVLTTGLPGKSLY